MIYTRAFFAANRVSETLFLLVAGGALGSAFIPQFTGLLVKKETELEDYTVSQWYTLGWGIFSIIISMFAYNIGNSLIEAVNIIGSFYGVILGVFLVAFWFSRIKGTAVFMAAIISECLVIWIYWLDIISFLWLNVIGALLVIISGSLLQLMMKKVDLAGNRS